MRLVDRSRIIAMQVCPRSRWLGYELGGTGLQRKSKGLALQFGSAFHEGSEVLLTTADVDAAVTHAKGYLRDKFRKAEIAFEDADLPKDALKAAEYGQEEQEALAEALLRGWWAFEGEAFLRDFEVIAVEAEGRAVLTDDLTLMYRPDAVVRDRTSGDYFVISWKTCATFSKRNNDQSRHDMQSISEVWGVQEASHDKE